MVAAHGNIRKSGMFSPYGGRLAEATASNIQAAMDGKLKVNLPWLLDCYHEQPATNDATMMEHSYHIPLHPLTSMW